MKFDPQSNELLNLEAGANGQRNKLRSTTYNECRVRVESGAKLAPSSGFNALPKDIMKKLAKIETISLTLTAEEAYALCNKLSDKALVIHGGHCEFDQIKLLQRIGKDLGELVGHGSSENDLKLDVRAAVRSAKL